MTKVLAINGSPNMEKGNTHLILEPFLEGMKNAGAVVDLIFPRNLKIQPCIGDFQCWYEKVGVCIYKDDMEEVYAKAREADIWVLATPIYLPLPGRFQNLLNRLMPLFEPLLEVRNARTRAKLHDNVRTSKIVLITSGGWWEKENADVVVHIVREIAENCTISFLGPIYRPHSDLLRHNKEKAAEIFDAARIAGQQAVEKDSISQEIIDSIAQPLISLENAISDGTKSYLKARDS
jgi:multimeric flavodoxin WrbA